MSDVQGVGGWLFGALGIWAARSWIRMGWLLNTMVRDGATRWWITISVAIVGLCLAGCGGVSEPHRIPVRGVVQLNGNLVAQGAISFFPAAGVSGPAAVTVITAGQYEFTQQTGPYPGAHRVMIDLDPPATHANGDAGFNGDTGGGANIKASLGSGADPARTAIRKTHWELEFSVPADGTNTKDFTLLE